MTKGDDTRRAILGEALSLASEVGLAGVTIGALADRVKMSKSGLFAHFSSKDKLDVAILDEAGRRFVDMVVVPALRQKRGEPRVRALFDHWLGWAKQDAMPGGCVFVAAAAELDDKPGPARDKLVASQKDWLGVLSGAARIAMDEGDFRPDLDPDQFAFETYAIAFGFHTLMRLLHDRAAEKRARTAFDRLVRDARVPRAAASHAAASHGAASRAAASRAAASHAAASRAAASHAAASHAAASHGAASHGAAAAEAGGAPAVSPVAQAAPSRAKSGATRKVVSAPRGGAHRRARGEA